MRPTSKVIQLSVFDAEHREFLALCEDGSIWIFDGCNYTWRIASEMDGGKYV